jgi:hypothetical protein
MAYAAINRSPSESEAIPNNVTEDILPTGRVGRLCPLLVGVSAQAPEPLIHERLRTRVPDIHRPTAERFAKLDYSHPAWGPLLIGRFARLHGPDPTRERCSAGEEIATHSVGAGRLVLVHLASWEISHGECALT